MAAEDEGKSVGWTIHYETGQDSRGLINAYTEGLQKLGHLDFQCVLPLGEKVIDGLFSMLVDMVAEGEVFAHGDPLLDGEDLLAVFVMAQEGTRRLLRVVVCDPDTLVGPGAITDEQLKAQVEGTALSIEEEDGQLSLVWEE